MEQLDEMLRLKEVKAKPNIAEQGMYQAAWRELAERDGMSSHTIDYLIRGNVFLAGIAFMEYCEERPDGDEILQEVCEDITRTQDHIKRRQVFNTLLACLATSLKYTGRPDRAGYLASMIVKVATYTGGPRAAAVTGGLERSLRNNLLSQISPGTELPNPEDMKMTQRDAEEFAVLMQILIKRLEHVRMPERQELVMYKIGAWIGEIDSWAADAGNSGHERKTGKLTEPDRTEGSEQERYNVNRIRNFYSVSSGPDAAEGKSLIGAPHQSWSYPGNERSEELGRTESGTGELRSRCMDLERQCSALKSRCEELEHESSKMHQELRAIKDRIARQEEKSNIYEERLRSLEKTLAAMTL